MLYEIFNINENGNLVINTKELLAIESFNNIISRDKGSGIKGNKVLAFKELAYIWFRVDYNSPVTIKGLTGKKADEFIRDKIGLPSDWVEDELIKKAIADYKDCQTDATQEVIKEIIATFSYFGRIVSKVRKSIETHLDTKAGLNKDQADELVKLMSTIISISKAIPTEARNLNEALVELRKKNQLEDVEVLRGSDDIIPLSADVDKDF